jgi:hypothetical protein
VFHLSRAGDVSEGNFYRPRSTSASLNLGDFSYVREQAACSRLRILVVIPSSPS